VFGLDIDVQKVQLLNHGKSYIKHNEPSAVTELVSSGKFSAFADFNRIKQAGAVICAPTSVTKNREPDISFVIGDRTDGRSAAAKGTLVVLESSSVRASFAIWATAGEDSGWLCRPVLAK
jgi:UDP-N-acetyl-D-glucosamine dehydrogenase